MPRVLANLTIVAYLSDIARGSFRVASSCFYVAFREGKGEDLESFWGFPPPAAAQKFVGPRCLGRIEGRSGVRVVVNVIVITAVAQGLDAGINAAIASRHANTPTAAALPVPVCGMDIGMHVRWGGAAGPLLFHHQSI